MGLQAFASHNDSLYTMTYDYHKQDQPLVIHKLDLGKMKWHKVGASLLWCLVVSFYST